jgi:predicted DNA-binding ribbon-helix-helix protein
VTRASPRVVKHSVSISGHSTSISLEEPFWDGVKALAAARGQSLSQFIVAIDAARGEANLSSALRVAVLDHYRGLALTGAALDATGAAASA